MRKEVIQIGKESEAIQKVYEDMYAHTNGTDGISMIKFSGSWGYRNSKDYLEQELDYNSTVVMLAKACNVRFYDGNFYSFLPTFGTLQDCGHDEQHDCIQKEILADGQVLQ